MLKATSKASSQRSSTTHFGALSTKPPIQTAPPPAALIGKHTSRPLLVTRLTTAYLGLSVGRDSWTSRTADNSLPLDARRRLGQRPANPAQALNKPIEFLLDRAVREESHRETEVDKATGRSKRGGFSPRSHLSGGRNNCGGVSLSVYGPGAEAHCLQIDRKLRPNVYDVAFGIPHQIFPRKDGS
jgi:hypothetical protein